MSVDITSVVIKAESVGITQAAKALDGLATSAAVVEKGVTALSSAMTKLNTLNMSGSAAVESYMSKLREQAAIMQALNASAKGAAGGTEALVAAMALLASSMNLINNRLQENVIRQRASNVQMAEAHALARGLSGSLGALWITYGNFAGMAVGLAIGVSLKGIITVGKDVENTLEGIRVRGNETIEAIKELRAVVYDLGSGVYGPQQVAKALETLVLAGLNASQAVSSIGAALNLATVGGTSIEKAATTLVSVGTSIGYAAEGFSRVGDVIAKTAALSMSSVETLSEAFKSASSVNKLYGVSLEDIGTSLGVLSNLGIQGSAAGTALKNFYKELASESAKVSGTFKDMGFSQKDFKDSAGNFLPLLEVIQKLDTGLKTLDQGEQKLAQSRTSNERGQRLMTQLLGEYNVKLADGSNALEEFRKNVENSYGFAAKGAAQMALTANSQIQSMMNSLKTSFSQTFTQIEPEVIAFSTRLKSIFASKEFKDGLITIAQSFATVAVAIAENIPLIFRLVEGLILFKVALAIIPMLQAIPAVITSITTATTMCTTAVLALRAGTLTLAAAFPPLLIAVGLATVAITAYNLLVGGEAADKHYKNAQAYSNGYIEGLVKEAENLEKVNIKMRQKMTLADAMRAAEKDASKEKMIALDNEAIREAEANLKKTQGNFDVNATLKAMGALSKARLNAANNLKLAAAAEATLNTQAKENARLAKEGADARRKQETDEATNKLGVKPDKAGVNDAYASALEEINGRIKKTKIDLQNFEDQQNNRFKAGEIGKLEVIRTTGEKEIEEYTKRAEEIQKQIDIASGGKNKKADVARFSNSLNEVQDALAASRIRTAQEEGVALVKVEEETTKSKIKELETLGKYVEAAMLQFGSTQGAAMMQAQADAKKYGDEFPLLIKRVKQFEETLATMKQDAKVKEATVEFDNLYKTMTNGIKGVQTASESGGLGEMLSAAMKASEEYKASLPSLEEALKKVRDAAKGGSPESQGKYEEELTKQKNLAEKYRTMWAGVGESISKSLGSAFGNSGKSLGSLITQFSKFNDLDKQTASQRVKSYGDMVGAAKGFFKEGSTGYKVMETAERAFRIVELAGMAQSLAATIANAAAKAAAYVPTVFMSFMASMGPWGMAAAGVAIAAVLGGAFSGGGGAPTQTTEEKHRSSGTGTVLGDANAKSESIQRALDIIAKDSGLQLVHSQSMVISLKQIVSGIGGLGSILNRAGLTGELPTGSKGAAASFGSSTTGVALTGGIIGLALDKLTGGLVGKITGKVMNSIFGGKTTAQGTGLTIDKTTLGQAQDGVTSSQYTNMKKDGGIFSSDKYWTDKNPLGKAADAQFTAIFKNMADTVSAAGDILGIGGTEFTNRLNSFVVDIGKVDLKGLTGEEQQKKLEAVFSGLGDRLAEWTVAGIGDFQNVGEGLLETLARMANQVTQVSDVFAVLGKDFSYTGYTAMKLSDDLVNAAGDIETLTTNTKFFVDNFLTMEERMKPITNSLNEQLKKLGVSTSLSEAEFKKLILSQDLTSTSGQNMYTALIALAPAFKQSSDYAWDLANGTVELTKAQQRAKDLIDKSRSALQDAYDEESSQLEKTIDKLSSFAAGLKSFQDSLLTGSSSPLTNAQKYAQTLANFEAISTKAKAGDATAQAGFQAAANELLTASKKYNASSSAYTDDFNRVMKETANLASSTQTQIGTAQASLDALNKQVDGLLTINASVLTVTQAITNLQSAITAGRVQGLTDKQMGLEIDGSHASGLPFVPKDDYIAKLHKGERVLTASESSRYNGRGQDSAEVVEALRAMEEKLADAVEKLTVATVESNFRATDAAAEKTVEGLDAIMSKKNEKVKSLKLN